MLNDTGLMAGAAFDATSLNRLKTKAGQDPQGNLKEVARQVEGMFVQMMLKSMRDALPKDGIFSSESTRMYTSMYDQQIAQQLSAKGLGFADVLVKQMSASNGEGAATPEVEATVPMRFEPQQMSSYQSQSMAKIVRQAVPRPAQTSIALSGDSRDFLAQLSLPAKLASEASGIPHHLILAQAALESGWGQRQIRTEQGTPSFNLFGIKASGDWRGKVTEITTTEFENGESKKVKARFRVYDSYLESLSDYVSLLTRNPRYTAVANASSAEQGAHALQKAGYATDPDYAKKLTGMIQQLRAMNDKVAQAYSTDLSNLF
ncbi:flagellar assembly peptidoglycan hydrolase FlgJ [Klebsiella sp. BIGb0407]|uniref:flagellar assembly peptidoglycan hydrolase FlgJ n=1 Tax=Klebsiella sp. BIGb0407 TaxID=2940603 RepID=UPI0021670708|nr:flagellar assembly peptidoglycan hydrolase FlgJ [Klebsiella sp. BIGb0407]MCS3433596.1 flagellar protein FlgJ [Klebsiella sp. BIGb0407]